ncbi:MAG: hypothetical protein ABI776_18485, partial [Nocardioidaceae bacterium]
MDAVHRLRVVAALSVVAATAAACGSGPSTRDDAPPRPSAAAPTASDGSPAPAAGCGTVPTSSGPLAGAARLEVSLPGPAAAGSDLRVSATVVGREPTARLVTTAGGSALLVTDGDRVVARADGVGAGGAVPLRLTRGARRPAQLLPAAVPLVGCGGAGPLTPGRYAVVAVLGYRLDPLDSAVDGAPTTRDGGRTFVLVSQPV